jgi:hypothetical protein
MAVATHVPAPQALLSVLPRTWWLTACWAVACGAHVVPRPDSVVAVALADRECRLTRFGARAGLPHSLASVYSGAVARFLGGSVTGAAREIVNCDYRHYRCSHNDLRIGPDGTSVLLFAMPWDNENHDDVLCCAHWPLGGMAENVSWPYLNDIVYVSGITDAAISRDGTSFALMCGRYWTSRGIIVLDASGGFVRLFPVVDDAFAVLLVGTELLVFCPTGIQASGCEMGDKRRFIPQCLKPGAVCGLHLCADFAFVVERDLLNDGAEPPHVQLRSAHDLTVRRDIGRGVLSLDAHNHRLACSAFDELVVTEADRVLVFSPCGARRARAARQRSGRCHAAQLNRVSCGRRQRRNPVLVKKPALGFFLFALFLSSRVPALKKKNLLTLPLWHPKCFAVTRRCCLTCHGCGGCKRAGRRRRERSGSVKAQKPPCARRRLRSLLSLRTRSAASRDSAGGLACLALSRRSCARQSRGCWAAASLASCARHRRSAMSLA